MAEAILVLFFSLIFLYPFYAPMPEWRKRQLRRKRPMKGRIIDI